MYASTAESGAPIWWLSYDPRIGLDDLKVLSRTPLAAYLLAAPGTDLIRLEFMWD
jgi:hypothetical protein